MAQGGGLGNLDKLLDGAEQCRVVARHSRQLNRLKTTTHFNEEELVSLLVIFHKTHNVDGRGVLCYVTDAANGLLQLTMDGPMDRKKFKALMHTMYGMCHWVLIDRLFIQFERDRCGYIVFEMFAKNMSIFLRGTLEEKARFTFATYDVNGSGFILRENMVMLLRKSIFSADDGDELVKELSEVLVKKLDKDQDGKVNVEDFVSSVQLNPNLVESLGPSLPSRKPAYAFISTFARNPGRY